MTDESIPDTTGPVSWRSDKSTEPVLDLITEWEEEVTYVQHRVWGPGDTYQTANGKQVDFPAGTKVRRFVTKWERVEE